jgi:eukaryotic-like serine/threonine-protein kinase
MVTGTLPFTGETAAVIFEGILTRGPTPPSRRTPAMPLELERIVLRALEKDRETRYQTAADLRADLKRVQRASGSGSAIAAATPAATSGTGIVRAGIRRRWMLPAAGVVVLATAAGVLLWSRRAPALTERDTVLLADFTNTTGEQTFDGTLRQALAIKLEETPFLNLFPQSSIGETLRLMERQPGERLHSDLARQVCQRQGLKAMLAGSIATLGSHYVVTLDATNCQTGDTIASAQGEAENKEAVLNTLGAAATSLRAKLGESLASIERYDAPVEAATTSSFEALHAFSQGQALRDRDDDRAAIPLLKRAVELDPNFALAYARLGAAYFNERQMGLAREHLTKAFELRNRASERERLYIEARYTDAVTGDVPKLIEIYSRWKQIYPRDWTAPNNLGIHYSDLGDNTKAVEESLLALKLNPDAAYAYGNLALAYVDTGRLDEARSIIDQAVGRGRDGFVVHLATVLLAARRNDSAGVQKAIEWFQPRDPASYFRFSSAVAARAGRMRDSRALTEKCIATSRAEGNVEGAANQLLQLARAEALYGDVVSARRIVPEALATSSERFLLALAAGVLAEAGDLSGARSLVDRSAREYAPTDTIGQQTLLPTMRAAIELGRGQPAAALQALAPSDQYDCNTCRSTQRYQHYLRARARAGAGQTAEALAEFRRLIDGAGAGIDALTPFAYLGLARVAGKSGDTATARRAYQDLLAIWKGADADLPAVKMAREEYAGLK